MPRVKGKKYPYTKAGKAAAKKAAKVVTTGARNIAKAAATVAKKSKTAKSRAKASVTGAAAGAGAGKVLKGLKKGALKRTPAQIARIRTGGRNAKKKRKAGKGHQK